MRNVKEGTREIFPSLLCVMRVIGRMEEGVNFLFYSQPKGDEVRMIKGGLMVV